jgi:photosystem II stability/assembly factor-like uncharacterized protein
MKTRITFLVTLSLLLSNICFSQSGWVQINPGFGHFYNAVHFINASTGFACGSNGAMIKTTNSGLNWIIQNSGTSTSLNDVKMFTQDVIVAVGEYQLIIRTTNSGQNWSVVHPAVSEDHSIVNLNIHNTSQATAFSEYWSSPYYYRYIYRTSDMGASWIITQTYVAGTWIHFIDLNTGWAYGSTYYPPPINQYYLDVNKTVDGGQNWTLISRGSGVSINPGMIYFYSGSLGFKYSHMGTVYFSRTNDGGYNWGGTGLNLNQLIRSFYFVNSQKGWIVGDNSIIYVTSNSGINWVQQTSPVTANLKMVNFIDENTGWIAAGSMGILKTTTGGVLTGFSKEGNEIPLTPSLNQNYPNPFNPVTKIKFDIPLSRGVPEGRGVSVQLIIYDLLGREVTTLVNELMKPGIYEVDWDGSSSASGVYFYRLITDEYVETKKMVLLK